jgi:FixJ family two-component response regulator
MIKQRDDSAPIVFVIDDDSSVRDAMSSLFRSVGLKVELFASPAEFLQAPPAEGPSCLVLDVRLPGLSGLDFQSDLDRAGIHTPIVFMTGHGDIPMAVKAMKAGAVEFLSKPFRDQDMLDAVRAAFASDLARREREKTAAQLRGNFEKLTAREQEIMALVAAGLMNKQIAAEIGVSEITVKFHRGNVTRKMGARSIAELVRMADMLGLRRVRT